MIFPQSDIRSQIISILSEQFPLSFRKISNKLKKIYFKSISDKALYRTIGLMVKEAVLVKKDSEYLINAEWLNNLNNFTNGVAKTYLEENVDQKDKRKIYAFVKQECSCKKGDAEGFCFVCNEPVCPECGEKTRLHHSCLEKCENCSDNSVGYCANCLKKACTACSKEVWAHFSENCVRKPNKAILGILEVDHQCWFADLSENLESPVILDSFVDEKDAVLGTHSGRVMIETADKKMAISKLLKHKQIVDVKPLYSNKQLILRTRALFSKSVDEFVRKNRSILLNPIKASNTKERNLIIAPNYKDINRLIKGLNEVGRCRLIASEEIELNKLNSLTSKEIISFVKIVNKSDLDAATQKILLTQRLSR